MLTKKEVIRVYRSVLNKSPNGISEIKDLIDSFDTASALRAALIDKSEKINNDISPENPRESYIDDNGFVDADKLGAYFLPGQHQQNANNYFSNIVDPWQYHLRKPYAEVNECSHILAGLSAIFSAMKLAPGQQVLDFGCGTGWLSEVLANLRCRVVGLDVSAAAIDIAERGLASHPIRNQLDIEFAVFDGQNIPFEDASFDRIICFDSFHHVFDQDFIIGEFSRILRAGGIVAFHEPGPTHAFSPQSQYEMKNYGVIENNIITERIWSVASANGFGDIKMIMNTQQPFIYSLEDFNSALSENRPSSFYEEMGRRVVNDFENKRIFIITKMGDEQVDSRRKTTLGGEIIVREFNFNPSTRDFTARLTLRNIGTGRWMVSGGELGSVNVGVRLFSSDGTCLDGNYSRHQVLTTEIPPGGERMIEIGFPITYEIDNFIVEFDLVSELVSWFSEVGCAMPRVKID
jgi:ubiquinone/menaquinone biosynthesis C-methylase UbiE